MEEQPYTPPGVDKESEEQVMVSQREQSFNNFIAERKAYWEKCKAEKDPDEIGVFQQVTAAEAIREQATADSVLAEDESTAFQVWTGRLIATDKPLASETAVALLKAERNAGRALLGKEPIKYDPRNGSDQTAVENKWRKIQNTLIDMMQKYASQ